MGYWFFVVSRVPGKFAIKPDGHRRIVDHLLPGDIVSLKGKGEEDFFREAAVNDATIAGYTRKRIEELTAGDAEFAREIHDTVLGCVRRLERQLLILGRITAREKVAGFLLEFAARLDNGDTDSIMVPISRASGGVSSHAVAWRR